MDIGQITEIDGKKFRVIKKTTKVKVNFVQPNILKAKGMDKKAQEEADQMGHPKD